MRKFYLRQLLFAIAIFFTADLYAQCPTITLGPNPSVCTGTGMVSFPYTATTGLPNQYRIDWDNAANAAGIPDSNNQLFPANPSGGAGTFNIFFFPPPAAATYSGILYVRNGACEISPGKSISVTFTPGTAVTGVTWPNVCQGTSSSTLTFTSSGSPNQYAIDWHPDSNTAGLIDVPLTTVPGGPIPITNIPAAGGIYYGVLTVKNTTTGCVSNPWTFAVVVGSNITLGVSPTICFGTTTASLPFSAVTLGANQYRIDWDGAANTSGFSDLNWTTLPASPITISGIPAVSGVYSGNLFVRNSSGGCESSAKPISVTIGPTITLGANPITCSASFVSISYTATTGGPNQYRIDWNATANSAGIADVSLTPFPGGSILNFGNIPAPVGTYNGTLFVKSTGSGCESSGYPVSVTVSNKPTITPGPNPTVCAGTTTTPLTYTATTGSPTQYNIDWDALANAQGLPDAAVATLPPSPITIAGIPTFPPGGGGLFLGTLYVRSSGLGCVSTGSPITLTKLQTFVALGMSPTVCQGTTSSSIPYSSTTGSPNQYRIDWNSGLTDVPVTALPPSPIPIAGIPTTPGVYTGTFYAINSSTGCEYGHSVSVSVNGVTGGTISNNQTICSAGDPASFTQSVASTGTGSLSYNWQSSTDNITFTDIAGATAIAYDIPAGLLSTTYYKRKTTSLLNSVSCTAFSNSLTIMVNSPVTGGAIAGNQTVCSTGDPAAFTEVTASTGGGPLTYQWMVSNDNINFSAIGLATGITYDPSASSLTRYFKRRTGVTQNGFVCYAFSNTLTVSVNAVTAGSVTSIQFGSQKICSGGDPVEYTVSAAATGSGTLTYQWQISSPTSASFSNIVGATGSTYDPPAGVVQTTFYRRVVTSVFNGISCTAISNNVSASINAVTGGNMGISQTICSGGDPSYFYTTFNATYDGTPGWQWQSSSDNTVFTNIGGATSGSYDVPAGLTTTTYYKRVSSSTLNGVTCYANSNTLTVTVNTVSGGVVGTDQSVCQGSDPAAFTQISPSSGPGTLTYQWQSSLNGSTYSNIPSATSTVYDVPVGLTQTTYYKRVTNSTSGIVCSSSSNALTLTYTPGPTNSSISASPASVCVGQSVTISSSGGSGTPYYWASTNGGANWDIFAQAYGGQSSFNYTPTQAGTYRFYVYNYNGCGFCWQTGSCGPDQYIDVIVKPLPSVYAYATGPICAGGYSNLSAYGADSYSWSPATALTTTTGPSTVSTASVTTTYTMTGTTNGCSNTYPVTVNVNPQPVNGQIFTSATSICVGDVVTISSTGGNGTPYYWASSDGTQSWNVFAQGHGGEYSFPFSTSQPGTYYFFLYNQNSCGFCWQTNSCNGSDPYVTVTVTPNPQPYISATYNLCSDGYTLLTANGTPNAISYEWSTGESFDSNLWADTWGSYWVIANYANCSSSPAYFYVNQCYEYCYDEWGNAYLCDFAYLTAEGVLGIYPNPASDVVSIQIPKAAEANLEVSIHSQLGTEVGRTAILKGKTDASFDTRKLADGIYIITLKAPDKVIIRQKVIIKH